MEVEALVCAYQLDGQGHGRPLTWDGLRQGAHGDGGLWVHLHRAAPETRRWLSERSGLDPALMAYVQKARAADR